MLILCFKCRAFKVERVKGLVIRVEGPVVRDLVPFDAYAVWNSAAGGKERVSECPRASRVRLSVQLIGTRYSNCRSGSALLFFFHFSAG